MPPVSEISEMLPLCISYFHLVQWFLCLLVCLLLQMAGQGFLLLLAGDSAFACTDGFTYSLISPWELVAL